MTAGGARLRLCPFCGAAGRPEVRRSGAIAFVRCQVCLADGPSIYVEDFISDCFHDLTPEEQDTEWNNAISAAMLEAVKGWNGRHWESNCFPEDLERMAEKMEQEADV